MKKPGWATDPDKVLEEQAKLDASGAPYGAGCASITTMIIGVLVIVGSILGIVATLRGC